MSESPGASSPGVRVPGWLIGAITVAATLIGLGFLVGQRMANHVRLTESMNYRLCLMERDFHRQPSEECQKP
jgi:hypothetical protein